MAFDFFRTDLVNINSILKNYHNLSSFYFINRESKFDMDWDFTYYVEFWDH